MKKKIVVLMLCTFLLAGCGKSIPTLKDGSQAVVSLKKGNISVDDLYNEIKDKVELLEEDVQWTFDDKEDLTMEC